MNELEALEACYWLKATGFSSFVKMYEEKKFPVEMTTAKKSCEPIDHDSLFSLIKRLETLNRCASLLQKQNIQLTKNSECYKLPTSIGSSVSSEVDKTSTTINSDSTGVVDLRRKSLELSSVTPKIVLSVQSKEVDSDYRSSFYDNVAAQEMNMIEKTNSPMKITFKDIEINLDDNKIHRLSSEDDDDDDDCSILSQEEDEDDEEVEDIESIHSLHHLGIPGGHMKAAGMGSVDSGVPSSPILRSPSVRRRRVRWHSFQKSCERESMLLSNNIMSLSAGQLNVLKKLSLLRLTALIERYSCNNRNSWNWTVPKLLKKLKVPDYKDKNIFGVPLLVIAERTGSPIPHSILLALNRLSRLARDSVGIFRKSGMRSRIDKLRLHVERNPGKIDLDGYSVYDIADMLKQYFRELPEPLLTTKLADTFITIHKDIPNELRLQAMQLTILLMPDENRHVLQTLLLFLNEVASHSMFNQMCEKNLATCFVPAFFHLCGGGGGKLDRGSLNSAPKKLKRSASVQCQKELEDTRAAQECLASMMKCARFLFCVPDDVMMKSQFSYIEQGDPVSLEDLGQNGVDPGVDDDYHHYIDSCFAGLLQETSQNTRTPTKWELHSDNDEISISYRKVNDGYPLRVWRAVTEVHASPEDILKRVVKERHLWDDEMIQWEVLETLDDNTDVFYYEMQSVAPSVKRDFVILRSWRTNLTGGSCGSVMTSVKHKHEPTTSGVRGTVLACRCLIEPVGLGRSKFTFISRIDLRGRSSRYYNKAIAPRIMSAAVTKVRESFNCGPDGPETNV